MEIIERDIANRPMTGWASVRVLSQGTPTAWAPAPTAARLRGSDPTPLIGPMDSDDRGQSAYAVAAMCDVAQGMAADHKFSTRLGPSASPPV